MIVIDPKKFVSEYSIKSLVCCFSGGKDSLVATHYILSEVEDFKIDKYVVLADTTVMIPVAIDFVKDVCNKFGWTLKILRPEPDFWTLAEKWGCPSMRRRWCCYALKLKPIFDFVRSLSPQRAMVTGMRKDESARRMKMRLTQIRYDKRRRINAWDYHPILHWSEKDVLNYIKQNNLPTPPHYRLGFKETCYCGAFGHVKEFMLLRALFPELYERFIDLEEKWALSQSRKKDGTPRTAFYDKGLVSAKELAKQKHLKEFSVNGS